MMSTITYGLALKGNGHYLNDTECQDSILFSDDSQSKDYQVLAVADGHGGSPYCRSKIGSQLAVSIAKQEMSAFLVRNKKNIEDYEMLKNLRDKMFFAFENSEREDGQESLLLSKIKTDFESLKTTIVEKWSKAILEDLSAKPVHIAAGTVTWLNSIQKEYSSESFIGYGEISDSKLHLINKDLPDNICTLIQKNPKLLYGCTLLCVGKIGNHHFVLQLGDGDIVAIAKDNSSVKIITKSENLVGNETDSLCQNQAVSKFQTAYYYGETKMLMLSTDGIVNALESESDLEELARGIYDSLADEPNAFKRDFPAFLRRFSDGSSDDCTIGFIASGLDEKGYQSFISSTCEDLEAAPNNIAKQSLFEEYEINNEYYAQQLPFIPTSNNHPIKALKIGMEALTKSFLKKDFQEYVEAHQEYNLIPGISPLLISFLQTGTLFFQDKETILINKQKQLYRDKIDSIVEQNPFVLLSLSVTAISIGEDGTVLLNNHEKEFYVIKKITGSELLLMAINELDYQYFSEDFADFVTFVGTIKILPEWRLFINKYDLTIKKETEK